jgi:hypothetical protein
LFDRPVDLEVGASFEPMHVTIPAESLTRIITCVTSISTSDPNVSAVAVASVRNRFSVISHRTSAQLLNALDRRMIIDLNLRLAGPKVKLPIGAKGSGSSYGLYMDFGEVKFIFYDF